MLQGRRGQEDILEPVRTYKQHHIIAARFLQYVVVHFQSDDHWFLDAGYGEASRNGMFSRLKKTSTKMLYNYVDLGLLPSKTSPIRETSPQYESGKAREKQMVLGRSIGKWSKQLRIRKVQDSDCEKPQEIKWTNNAREAKYKGGNYV